MTKNLINHDYRFKPNTRTAVKISQEELFNKVCQLQNLNPEDIDMHDPDDLEQLLIDVLPDFEETAQILQDIPYPSSTNAINVNPKYELGQPEETPLLGFHTLPNGLTFLGFTQSDGEAILPAFHILYFDGNDLHIYEPVRGNRINLDFKTALGAEEYLSEEDEDVIMQNYQTQGIFNPDLTWMEMYLLKYQLDPYDNDVISWNAILDEITTSIQVL